MLKRKNWQEHLITLIYLDVHSRIVVSMIFTIFDCLNAHLQKIKKTQTHHNWFWINCSKLVKLGLDLGPMTISISWLSFMTK